MEYRNEKLPAASGPEEADHRRRDEWKHVIFHGGNDGHYTVLEYSEKGFLRISKGIKGDNTVRETVVIKLNAEEELVLGKLMQELAMRELAP